MKCSSFYYRLGAGLWAGENTSEKRTVTINPETNISDYPWRGKIENNSERNPLQMVRSIKGCSARGRFLLAAEISKAQCSDVS
jgi:hypothetical protein